MKETEQDHGRDEQTAINLSAAQVKELRRSEGRSKEDEASPLR
jgi:hypothetical protein